MSAPFGECDYLHRLGSLAAVGQYLGGDRWRKSRYSQAGRASRHWPCSPRGRGGDCAAFGSFGVPSDLARTSPVVCKAAGMGDLEGMEYPLPLAGEMQLVNSAIAIATLQQLQSQGWQISREAIQQGMAQTRWPGRLQWLQWQGRKLLIDGAHNAPAAAYLRQYVDQLGWTEVTWVVGMLANKDHEGILKHLLRGGDRLWLVPVPDHASADLEDLKALAYTCCPELGECRLFKEVTEALDRAGDRCVVCGSLYLIAGVLGAIASKGSQATRL